MGIVHVVYLGGDDERGSGGGSPTQCSASVAADATRHRLRASEVELTTEMTTRGRMREHKRGFPAGGGEKLSGSCDDNTKHSEPAQKQQQIQERTTEHIKSKLFGLRCLFNCVAEYIHTRALPHTHTHIHIHVWVYIYIHTYVRNLRFLFLFFLHLYLVFFNAK